MKALQNAQVATYWYLAPWYAGLVKPSFNPPNWVFGPVWTTLYLLMAFAAWRILRLPEASAERRWALGFFIAQLALNAAWSWTFFAGNNPLGGLSRATDPAISTVPPMPAAPCLHGVSFTTVRNTSMRAAPRVRRSLYSRAVGYNYEAVKILRTARNPCTRHTSNSSRLAAVKIC
jgi:hypothetical protein